MHPCVVESLYSQDTCVFSAPASVPCISKDFPDSVSPL